MKKGFWIKKRLLGNDNKGEEVFDEELIEFEISTILLAELAAKRLKINPNAQTIFSLEVLFCELEIEEKLIDYFENELQEYAQKKYNER